MALGAPLDRGMEHVTFSENRYFVTLPARLFLSAPQKGRLVRHVRVVATRAVALGDGFVEAHPLCAHVLFEGVTHPAPARYVFHDYASLLSAPVAGGALPLSDRVVDVCAQEFFLLCGVRRVTERAGAGFEL
jgi:hypothetical protein